MLKKKKLRIEKSKYEKDYILWQETESLTGYGYRGVFRGTYQECLEEKERRENNVHKPKATSFRLLRKALHNR